MIRVLRVDSWLMAVFFFADPRFISGNLRRGSPVECPGD
jgi:hypothetical protein